MPTPPKRIAPFWVIDISNSFTKYALATSRGLGTVSKIPTRHVSKAWAKTLLKTSSHAVLSSVVPNKGDRVKSVFGKGCFAIQGDRPVGLKIDYPRKGQIGADRLANAVAALSQYGAPVIVLDFGTAVTFDVVNDQKAYCGGVIAPGLNAMTDYLHERTALLPRIKLRSPRRAIGKSTEEAMLAGAVYGYRGLVREILAALKKELHGKPSVVATGGQAELVTRGMCEIDSVNPLLTLEGLRIIGLQFLFV